MADMAGEADRGALRLDFDRRLLLQFRGWTITSDAGLPAYRELHDSLSPTAWGADTLANARIGKNGRHWLTGLLGQSVFGRLAGYEDVNDADRLCRNPGMRWVVGDRAITASAASASKMGRFEYQIDPAVMPLFCGQRRPLSPPRPSLQPWQLHADAGDAKSRGAGVADQPAREADQDLHQGRQPRPLRYLAVGRNSSYRDRCSRRS
jgi:hypothetical protein